MKKLLTWSLGSALVMVVIGLGLSLLAPRAPLEERIGARWSAPVGAPLQLPSLPSLTVPAVPPPTSSISPAPDSLPYQMEEPVILPPPEPAPPPEPEKPEAKARQGKPKLAIIIDDMGLSPSLSARAVKLPGPLTLSYLPYAPHVQAQANKAREAGHEVMLHLPMEPKGRESPGPQALRTSQSPEEWERLIALNLSSFEGYVGVNNHMGSRFTTSGSGMAFLGHALAQRNVFFVDSRTAPDSVADKVMRFMQVKKAARDVFLDHVVTHEAIRSELARAQALARRRGWAILIGHPHPETLDVLESWTRSPEAASYELVPVRLLTE